LPWGLQETICRRFPPLYCSLMQLVGSSNDKMGEGHPPLGVTKSKKGWCRLGDVVAILPSSK